MADAQRWPLRVLCALQHESERTRDGIAKLAFLAYGKGTSVYSGNIFDFERGETKSPEALEKALERFPSVAFVSFEAIYDHGWRLG